MRHRLLPVLVVCLLFAATSTAADPLTNPRCYTDTPSDDAAPLATDDLLLGAPDSAADAATGHSADITVHAALARADDGTVSVLAADGAHDQCGTDTAEDATDTWDEFYPIGIGDTDDDGTQEVLLGVGTDSNPLMYTFPIEGTGMTPTVTLRGSGDADGAVVAMDVDPSHDASQSADNVEVKGWQSVTIPGKSVEQDTYREGNEAKHEKKIWGQPTFDDLEMERGVKPGDTKLHDWFEDVRAGSADAARKEISVKLQDEEGEAVTQFNFARAAAKEYSPPELDASADGDMATESTTITFDEMIRTEALIQVDTGTGMTAEAVEQRTQALLDRAWERAQTNGRETVQTEDLSAAAQADDVDGVDDIGARVTIYDPDGDIVDWETETAPGTGVNAIDPETVDDIQALLAGKADEGRKEIAVKLLDEERERQMQWELVAGLHGGGDTVGGLIGANTDKLVDDDDGNGDSGAQSGGDTDEQERGITVNMLLEDADGDGTPDYLGLASETKTENGEDVDIVKEKTALAGGGDDDGGDAATAQEKPQRSKIVSVTDAPGWWDGTNTVLPGWLFDGVQLADEHYRPDAVPGAAKRVMAERMLVAVASPEGKKTHKLAVETGPDGALQRVAPVADTDTFDEQVRITTDTATVQMIMDAEQPGQMAVAAYRDDYLSVQGTGVVNRVKYGMMNMLGKVGMSLGLIEAGGEGALAEEEIEVSYDKYHRTQ